MRIELDAMQAITALAAALFGGGGIVSWYSARTARRQGVSSDEREARRDTIADRDAQIDQLQEDVEGLRAEVARLTALVRDQSGDLEAERAYNRVLVDHIYRRADPPPPART